MHHFAYRDGLLHAEDVDLQFLADEVGTPFYCYSTATLTRHYQVLEKAFSDSDHMIFYAMKANSNQAVIKTMAQLGAGMDVVSEGELRRALAAGVAGPKIVFSGVGKTAQEMSVALRNNILCFNVESLAELELLSSVATRMGTDAPVSLRINPDVDARTHEKITTGRADNKFGIAYDDALAAYDRARDLPGIRICGVDMHIGSQITELEPFEQAYRRLAELVRALRQAGHKIDHIDFGGGLGVPYRGTNDIPPHPDEFAKVVLGLLGDLDCTLMMEPGRMIAGNAGILVGRVIHVKETAGKTFFIADTAMNDLIRPTLYDAYHEILPVSEALADHTITGDLVGPVCESGDYIARNRKLPVMQAGDLFAVMTAGAYGAVQSGTYNSRPLVPEVLVKDHRYALVRPPQSFETLIGLDRLAPWQD